MRRPVALITGATDGIGLAASVALAGRGYDLLLVARSRTRADAARSQVARHSRRGAMVHTVLADLESMAEVRRLADEVRARVDHLDVLANNAGALFTSRQVTSEGLERTMALNHFAPLTLALELLPLLEAAPSGARVINTASSLHARGRLDLDDLTFERGPWIPPLAYGGAKLALMLATRELARRTRDRRIAVHAFHPGTVRTGFGKKDAAYLRLVWQALGPLLRTPERGARSLIYLATADAGTLGETGRYWIDEQPVAPAPAAQDDVLAGRLWERSAGILANTAGVAS